MSIIYKKQKKIKSISFKTLSFVSRRETLLDFSTQQQLLSLKDKVNKTSSSLELLFLFQVFCHNSGTVLSCVELAAPDEFRGRYRLGLFYG